MSIKIETNALDFLKVLKKRNGSLSIVSAETVNNAAKLVRNRYLKEMSGFVLRNKFTKGSIKIFKAKPTRSTGSFRDIRDINAVIGVRKMKGGKEHYLNKQETGATKRGNRKTMGSVAIPLDSARTGNSLSKPIKRALRLQNTSQISTLKVGSREIGTPSSGFNNRQSWAILYKYSGLNRGSKNIYGWDLKKPFFFVGLKSGHGVFQKSGQRITKIRNLEKKSIRIKALHKFEKSLNVLTPTMMLRVFNRAAAKYLNG